MKKKWILAATAAGLLVAAGAADASGMIGKVSGLLRNDVAVTVDGAATDMKPVFINGQAYLPARDEAAALGYDVSYSGKDKHLELHKSGGDEAADYARMSGVIKSVVKMDDGRYRIEALGNGDARWIMLYADQDTALQDADGHAVAADDLKAGMLLTAEYGPVVAMSYPGQSHAASVTVGMQTLIREDVVQAVERTDDGWQVRLGAAAADGAGGADGTALILNAGKETTLLDADGQPVKWEELAPGAKVRAYYGPITTKSLPPQSALHLLEVLDGAAAPSAGNAQQ